MTADQHALNATLEYARNLEQEVFRLKSERIGLREEVRRLRHKLSIVSEASRQPTDTVQCEDGPCEKPASENHVHMLARGTFTDTKCR